MAEEVKQSNEVEEGKVCAILAWIFPIGLIWYFVDEKMKKNSFAKFHVQQSLTLAIIAIALSVISMFVGMLGLVLLPIAGILLLVIWAVNIALFVLWIIGIIGAINGTQKELPIVGQYGKKFNI